MSKKRGLNKGRVDLLLSASAIQQSSPELNTETIENNTTSMQTVALENLIPSRFQPRKIMSEEELQELANSIKQQGLLQPIIVRKSSNKLEIIAGERRWRAAKLAGLEEIPVIVLQISDEEAMIIALVENMQRTDLNPMEEAIALEKLSREFNFTHEEIAKAVGKSRATVSNLLRLIQLHPEVKTLLENRKIELGHAKVLLGVETAKQPNLAEKIVNKHLSVRETEQLIHKEQDALKSKPQSTKPIDPDIARLQRSLSEQIGAIVKINHNTSGRGCIVIKYHSIDELDGILQHFDGE